MSKGTRITPVRIPPNLLAEIEMAVQNRNAVSPGEPWTLSDFIRVAAREKLAKMERSRRSGGRKAPCQPGA